MAKYRVVFHLNHNGKLYEPGETVQLDLSPEEEQRLHSLERIAAEDRPAQTGKEKK